MESRDWWMDLFVLVFAALWPMRPVLAQDCACDHTLTPASYTLWNGQTLGIGPGARICLPGSPGHGRIVFEELHGTPEAPIVITNCGGRAELASSLECWACTHVHITGAGDPEHAYGILIHAPDRPQSISCNRYASDIEVDHVEIGASNFAGIMIKTDDAPTSFVQANTRIHHNYIHDVVGEGIYLGYSFYEQDRAHRLVGTRVHHNLVVNSGWDGIQVGAADEDTWIYDNYVEHAGYGALDFIQKNGIQMGSGTLGRCFGNVVIDVPAQGIIMLGLGDSLVYNNLVVDAGTDGIWYSPRSFPRAGEHALGLVAHNTIIRPGQDGYELHSLASTSENLFQNNLVLKPGTEPFVNLHPAVPVTQDHNLFARSLEELGLAGDLTRTQLQGLDVHERRQAVLSAYAPLANSPLVDQGVDLSAQGVFDDAAGYPRSVPVDIGALELKEGAPPVTGKHCGGCHSGGDLGGDWLVMGLWFFLGCWIRRRKNTGEELIRQRHMTGRQ